MAAAAAELRGLLGPLHAQARVIVVTRDQCHLCHDALNLVARTCEPGQWADLDVDDHPSLRARFTDHVPVVFVDDRLLAYWTLTEEKLVTALRGGEWASPPEL